MRKSESNQKGLFPMTDWSLVLHATGKKSEDQPGDALSSLCQIYWRPLFAFVRSRGKSREEAEDIVQGFFAKLLRNQNLDSVGEEKGKLRTFLLTGVTRYMHSEWRKESALRRGDGVRPLSIDGDEGENLHHLLASSSPDPSQSFARGWAMTVIDQTVKVLREDFCSRGEETQFAILEPMILDTGACDLGYANIATALGVAENTVRVKIFRLRKRFREILREEVARCVESEDEVDEELTFLKAALRGEA